MQYTITLRGVPVGTLDVQPDGEFAVGAVTPLPGYPPIRALVRAASVALADVALNRGAAAASSVRIGDALRRGAELGRTLELRDASGALVPADFIELTEWPGGNPEVAAMVRFRDTHARIPAVARRRPTGGTDAAPPTA